MSNGVAHTDAIAPAVKTGELHPVWRRIFNGAVGLTILFLLWWLGGYVLSANPTTASFADFGPIPTFHAIPELWGDGKIQRAISASGYRLGMGLLIAFLIGVPLGILMGRSKRFRELSNSPFQFLRMVSPLSWMPLAVLIFIAAWDQSIIFLIAIASVWPMPRRQAWRRSIPPGSRWRATLAPAAGTCWLRLLSRQSPLISLRVHAWHWVSHGWL